VDALPNLGFAKKFQMPPGVFGVRLISIGNHENIKSLVNRIIQNGNLP